MPTIEDLLENPEDYVLSWAEPYPGLSREGEEVLADVKFSVSINGALRMSRYANQDRAAVEEASEARLLQDFMVVHWAKIERAVNPG